MSDDNHRDDVSRGRRKLLKAAAYAAPAILSVVVVDRAHAQVSCMPAAVCNPTTCDPVTCMPISGCMPLP